jgi:hypothetical protein
MKRITNTLAMIAIFLLASLASQAQKTAGNNSANNNQMKTYLIEREIPGAGQFDAAQLKAISQKSCSVLKDMGPKIQWIQSYVTGNKIVCVYQAENEELIREHGKKGGFPVTRITEIKSVISPATAN